MKLPAWHVHLDVWLLLGLAAAGYIAAIRRRSRERGEPVDRRHARMFVAGVAVLWLGADWPIHDLSERYLYSAHMVQHMLFTLVAAPLIVAGTPAWVLRRILALPLIGRAVRFLVRPIVALVLFNGLLLFTHWPEIVALSVRSELAHFCLHTALFGSALAMWWPILSPLPELPSLPAPGQMLYLFFQSLAPTIPASFLTFGTKPLYPVYVTFPRIWGIDALTDQLVAGLVMKLVGGFILWGVIAAIFFRWHRQEQTQGWDALGYRNVEREIRAGFTK